MILPQEMTGLLSELNRKEVLDWMYLKISL